MALWGQAPVTTPPLLSLKNVTLLRKGKKALDGLTLEIGQGENVALLGPNGSGKSSFIKLLTRELYPSWHEGKFSLEILGKDAWDVFELRSLLGIMSEDVQARFARPMTAWEAVLSGFFSAVGLWQNHQVTPEMEAKTQEVLERLELAHLAERRMNELSTGEMKRLLIARALVHAPKALILDEPTNSLDLHALQEFRQVLRGLVAGGTHVIMVTHNVQDLIPEIGRVILLREGKVFRDGPKDEVLTDKNLTDLFRMEVRLDRHDGYYTLR